MTEHKMTAKEYIISLYGEPENYKHRNEIETYASIMTEFALQVATEAVDNEIESYDRGVGKHAAKMHGKSILKNIKKRLNDAD